MKRILAFLTIILLLASFSPSQTLSQTKTVAKSKAAAPAAKPVAPGASSPLPPGDEKTPIVLKGGRLLTVSHGVIENGVLVMENGKITAQGDPADLFAGRTITITITKNT